ncbi:hypothetical protein M0R45_008843 [Rubus argutus]|uniref:Zinc knuckle CX2CX4HX4C domain-containing protein n=1 Tax=Rubus argutus TaxID=59490 RepID=A0AAW1Y5P7_RUBAR
MTKNPSPSPTAGGSSGAASGSPPPENRPKPSFASMLSKQPALNFDIAALPSPFEEEGLVSLRFSEDAYLRGLERCWSNLIGRLTIPFGRSPPKSMSSLRNYAPSCRLPPSGLLHLWQLKVSRSVGDSVLVGIEYETQPTICGCCGLVGHVESKCKVQVPLEKSEGAMARGHPQFRSLNSRRRRSFSRKFL